MGRAEEIPLPDDCVEAVFAADAFHWFDERRAMPEIKRVLRPGGGVAILRTVPQIDEPWSRELGEILTETRPEHPAFGERGAAAALEEDPGFGPVTETLVTSRSELDRDAAARLGGLLQLGRDAAPARARAAARTRRRGAATRTAFERESTTCCTRSGWRGCARRSATRRWARRAAR